MATLLQAPPSGPLPLPQAQSVNTTFCYYLKWFLITLTVWVGVNLTKLLKCPVHNSLIHLHNVHKSDIHN